MEIPKGLLEREGLTARQWKARKRRELKAVHDAFYKFRLGCAYTPVSGVQVMGDWLEQQRYALSVKKWGR